MSKYDNLRRFLEALEEDEWEADFESIENILGFSLPASARTYHPWWANQSGAGHSQTQAWQRAGWKTEAVDPQGETVRFVRVRRRINPRADENHEPAGLTIAQAKKGLSIHFQIPEDQIDVIIRG